MQKEMKAVIIIWCFTFCLDSSLNITDVPTPPSHDLIAVRNNCNHGDAARLYIHFISCSVIRIIRENRCTADIFSHG